MDTVVGLVKAYLELCGYFVLAELPVRAPEGGTYRDVTDLDIVAVRFPHPLLALPRRLGMNAAIHAAVRTRLKNGWNVFGVQNCALNDRQGCGICQACAGAAVR